MAITPLRAVQQYILREVLKDAPKGVMTTLPNKDLIEINVQVLAQRLMQEGIDPTKLKNANQVENAIKMIESRANVQTGFTTKKSADVFELQMPPKKIDPKKGIMGGKQIPDDDLPPPGSRGGPDDIAAPIQSSDESLRDMIEAEIKKKIEKENKEAAKKFKDKMKDDPEDLAQGGRAGFKLGTGKKGIQALLDFFNKKSPLQFGKDYLKDVKEKTLKAKETGKFMDLPLAEVGIPATTGILINNQLRKKLEAMNS